MKRSFLIVCSNLRKAKGQMAVISVLLLLAALMLNLSLMLMMDYKQNFNRCHDKLNDGHVTLVFNDNSKEIRDFVTETLENDNRTVQYQIENSLYMAGSFRYNNAELSLDLVPVPFFPLICVFFILIWSIRCFKLINDNSTSSHYAIFFGW